jgi:hypothetical protein
MSVIANHVPIEKPKLQHRHSFPPNLVKLIKCKSSAWSLYKRRPTANNLFSFRRISSRVKSETRTFYRGIEEKVLSSGSIKSFFSYVNSMNLAFI